MLRPSDRRQEAHQRLVVPPSTGLEGHDAEHRVLVMRAGAGHDGRRIESSASASGRSAHGILADGTWANGTWANGTWANGTWANGTWANGTWANGTWANGTWANGIWANGTWANGSWANGSWANGTSVNGSWANGTLANGTRANGSRASGSWLVRALRERPGGDGEYGPATSCRRRRSTLMPSSERAQASDVELAPSAPKPSIVPA